MSLVLWVVRHALALEQVLRALGNFQLLLLRFQQRDALADLGLEGGREEVCGRQHQIRPISLSQAAQWRG